MSRPAPVTGSVKESNTVEGTVSPEVIEHFSLRTPQALMSIGTPGKLDNVVGDRSLPGAIEVPLGRGPRRSSRFQGKPLVSNAMAPSWPAYMVNTRLDLIPQVSVEERFSS